MVSLLVIIPFLTAMAIIAVPSARQSAIKWVALAGSSIHLVLTAIVTARFWQLAVSDGVDTKTLVSKLYLVERIPWFPSAGIQYFTGVDGISVAMVILTSIIIFTGVLASWNVTNRAKEFFSLLFVLGTGVFGVFVSFDLFLFFMFYELAVLPMYLLIGVWGTGPKEYAAMKLTLMLLIGSVFVLVGILAMYHQSPVHTFDIGQLAAANFSGAFQKWVFPLVFIGFGVIGALYPLHTWSPDGHSSAPTAVSMLHAGVLMKLGGYGALRVGVYLLPEGAQYWALFFMVLATINIVYGSLGALVQKDLKYFTAYSSVSHCGFVLFGVAALNLMGFKGAVLQMFSHGIMTGLFFALIGMVYSRTHTRIIPEMGGLGAKMPWLAVMFYIAGFASLGLPGLSGFVAETHVFLGGFFGSGSLAKTLTLISVVSIVVTAVYVLRGLAKVFQGPITNESFKNITDAAWPERVSTFVLAAVLFAVGLYPSLFIKLFEGSLMPILNRLNETGAMVVMK